MSKSRFRIEDTHTGGWVIVEDGKAIEWERIDALLNAGLEALEGDRFEKGGDMKDKEIPLKKCGEYEGSPDAGGGGTTKCPSCKATLSFTTSQWWDTECECGTWEMRAVLIKRAAIRPSED